MQSSSLGAKPGKTDPVAFVYIDPRISQPFKLVCNLGLILFEEMGRAQLGEIDPGARRKDTQRQLLRGRIKAKNENRQPQIDPNMLSNVDG